MPKIAALYDIHGNLPALEAVLGEVARSSIDEVVVGGDVFPGPMASEALDRLLELDMPVHFLRGNGDRAVLTLAAGDEVPEVPVQVRAAMQWLAERLRPGHRDRLQGWPESVALEIEGLGRVLFCHATPRSDTEIFVESTPDDSLRDAFGGFAADLVVCGHTHMQFDRTVGGLRVVNAGSVGMPFDQPGAYWLELGPDVRLRCTLYDLEAAAGLLKATEYPDADDFAERSVLRPPSKELMLETFEAAGPGRSA